MTTTARMTIVLAILGAIIGTSVFHDRTPTPAASVAAPLSPPVAAPDAPSADGGGKLQPEMWIRFPHSGVVCLTQDALQDFTLHGLKGEKTKMNAMFVSKQHPDGSCLMLNPDERYRILATEYNNPDMPELGLIEIVGATSSSAEGAWALTAGAEPADDPKRERPPK